MLPRTSFQVYKVFSRNIINNSVDNSSLCRAIRCLSSLSIHNSSKSQDAINVSSSCLVNNANVELQPRLWQNERWKKISPGIPGIIIDLPRPSLTSFIFDLPPTRTVIPPEPVAIPSLEAPSSKRRDEKRASSGLVVIRRRKMKKHKLKKLRIKMKFEWAKVRQKREMRKEKAFQAVLLTQIREAEKFDAEAYVTEKLRQAKEKPLPRTWKGRRLPEFLIKQYMGIK
ncbi:hypothetical protein B566_EDAN001261 [Ephemera danica]|nr:hypothetical protein B566_EDAN001261 [Ephemera danica]